MRLVLSSLLVACSGGDATSDAKDCTVGDLALAPEIQLFYTNLDGNSVQMEPMDQVPLKQPIQGGYVFYVEPHIRNLDGCSVQLTTSLTDAMTNQLVVFESRTSTLTPDGSGWAVPINSENDGLVSACPQSGLSHNIDDQPYIVEVLAVDSKGRQAQVSVQVTPTCSETFCTCQCNASYHLGDNCP